MLVQFTNNPGRKATGAGLPVAVFGAGEGHAAGFLSDQDMTREIIMASRPPPGRAPCLSPDVSVRRMAASVRPFAGAGLSCVTRARGTPEIPAGCAAIIRSNRLA